MAVTYEWDVEELDAPATADDPEILDHNFCDTFAEAVEILARLPAPGRIVLVRHVGDDIGGETDRAWAYLTNGVLPETFEYGAEVDSGIAVPKRFHDEVRRA